jgi:hypothetical protein
MFQLIISILAIILAVALAGVSVYYGGSAFSNGSEKAEYATLSNQGAQIEAAMTLFRANTGGTATLTSTDLVEHASGQYLKQLPVSSADAFVIEGTKVISANVPDAVCAAAGDNAFVKVGTDLLVDGTTLVSASTVAEVVADQIGVAGCINITGASDGAASTFFYSL